LKVTVGPVDLSLRGVPIDLEPHAGGALVSVDRPAVCDLTEQHHVVIRFATLLERQAEQLAWRPQLDPHDVVGHPHAQLDQLGIGLASLDGARDQLTRQEHDGVSQIRRGPVNLGDVVARRAGGVGIETQRSLEVWIGRVDRHSGHEMPARARLKPA